MNWSNARFQATSPKSRPTAGVTAGFAAQKRLQLELVFFEPKFQNAKGLLDDLMLTADCGRYRCFGQVGKLR